MASNPNTTAPASVARAGWHQSSPLKPPGTSTFKPKSAKTLDELEAQFASVSAGFQALVDAAGTDRCSTRPAPNSWSAAECLQHLNLTADAFFPVWQQSIANAGPRKAELTGPYSTDFCGRLFSWILEPPSRIRSKTPPQFQPGGSTEISLVLAGFLDRQQRIVAALHRCRGRAIDKVTMSSPIDAKIRYSIWSSFVISAAHQRRHLWQAKRAAMTVRGD